MSAARTRRLLPLALLPFVVATAIGLVVLWPRGDAEPVQAGLGPPSLLVEGTVVSVVESLCLDLGQQPGDPPTGRCSSLTVRLAEGPDDGQVVRLDDTRASAAAQDIGPGSGVVLAAYPDAPAESRYALSDVQRDRPLLLLAVLAAVAVVAVGRWRGVRALLALAVVFGLLTGFVLPALLAGREALAVAVVGAAAIMLVTLYITHGLGARTTVALLGTLVSLSLTGALGALFVARAQLTGLASEESVFLRAVYGSVDLRGLLLAGIVLGALGVLDDVTVTQVSAVEELAAADPSSSVRTLYRAGLRIGRDHIASTVNTLVLAYAGASLPLLVLFRSSATPISDVLTSEVVASEVVRTLVGSLGLVAAVPVTTLLAAVVVRRGSPDDPPAVDPDTERWLASLRGDAAAPSAPAAPAGPEGA